MFNNITLIEREPDSGYCLLDYVLAFDHVVQHLRRAILAAAEQAQYTVRQGVWRRLSEVGRIMVREPQSVETDRCIYHN